MGLFSKKKGNDPRYVRDLPDKIIIRRLLSYLKPYKRDVILLIVLVVYNSIAALAYPIGTKFMLEYLEDENVNRLLMIAGILIGILILSFFSQRAYQYNVSKLGQYILYDLRGELFTHIQDLSVEYHTNMPAGKLMSRITNDVDTIQGFVSNNIIQFLGDVISAISMFVTMLIFSWELTLVLLALFPLFGFIFSYAAKRSRYYWRKQRKKISEITRILQETISGVKTIKAFVMEDKNIKNFDLRNRENRDISMQAAKINAALQPVLQLVIAGALGAVVFIGAELLDRGILELSTLLGYVILVTQFVNPLNRLGNFYNNIQSSLASGDRVLKIMDIEPKIIDAPDAKELPPIDGEVEYHNVWFEYEEDLPVLKDINFKTDPGDRYAFVGFTGAGKTTLVSLLSRFYDPKKGKITIDGHDIKKVTLDSLRSQIGVVLQDTFLFNGSVIDNIRYGKLDATNEEVVAAAKKVGAHPFIEKLPEGYDTSIRERGSLLSIGQRQLISFARALLSNPPILVLDEATSSVDPYTELKIQEALEVLLQERTSFIIAHRLSTILNSNVICVMEDGEIVQRGNHEELIRKGGLYKHLYELQFKRSEEKETLAARKES